MSINNNRFSQMPSLPHKSSSFKMPNKYTTTFNTGDLIPIYCTEILPGDVVKMRYKEFLKMTTPIVSVMDNAYLDTFFFYVPFRILYDKYAEFLGEKKDGYGIQETEYFLPSVYNITYNYSDLGAYFKLPVEKEIHLRTPINTLAFRAYVKIWNEFFRDENLQQPYECKEIFENFNYKESAETLSDVSRLQYGIGIAQVSKIHDLFTSCLPFTQKGPSVAFQFNQVLPLTNIKEELQTGDPHFHKLLGYTYKRSSDPDPDFKALSAVVTDGNYQSITADWGFHSLINGTLKPRYKNSLGMEVPASFGLYNEQLGVMPEIGFSVNELRTAVQMQRWYEQLARGGSRYVELLNSFFGVNIEDAIVQRPQFLYSRRFTINMSPVVQTSATGSVSPQGNVSGLSMSFNENINAFIRSFKEPGLLIGLACVRTNHTYIQSIPKFFRKLRRFDFYYPVFQSLGEQPVLNSEIYYSGDHNEDNKVFGYQEAWYEYRYNPSGVTGRFHDEASAGALWAYTYTDYFSTTPVLSDEFIKETTENVKRTLAVQDDHQFILDCFFYPDYTRELPLYSIPGLMDHF